MIAGWGNTKGPVQADDGVLTSLLIEPEGLIMIADCYASLVQAFFGS